ncbi:MAG: PEGA domain-containing protein [Bdellovibrionota bacterium]
MKRILSHSVVLVCLMSFSFACSSTTMIRSTDPEAKIYLDGELKGKGAVSQSDTKIIGSTTMVRLQREGCEERTFSYSRNEEFDVGACIGGVFLLFPFLWIQKYKPEHNYEYTCTPLASAVPAAAPARAPRARK